MKIVFLSNFYNHHQASLSKKLYELTCGEYRFIASTTLTDERKKLGYPELEDNFVITYDGVNSDVQNLIDAAEVVIFGSAPERWIENRKKQGKLIFRYSERPLKKGFEWWKYPYRFFKWHQKNPSNARIYMLCASAYTSVDYSRFGLFKNKSFRWGYFPECKIYDKVDELFSQKNKNELLWCGRFLDWKHPDDVLKVAKRLKDDGKSFHINIIGVGEMKSELEEMCEEYALSDYVTFLGSLSPENVREYMEKSGIYLFTSDRKEGWGAVLNEAMNSGCAVVASNAAGSTPYLIKNGENGFVYSFGDINALYEYVNELLENPEKQLMMGIKAYETIVNEWNADKAAERLVCLSERIIEGEKCPTIYATGPCSAIL